MSKVKVAFTTCVQLGRSCIERILELGGQLDLLVTLKDDRAKEKSGRIYLDDIAASHNIPLLKINNINDPEVLKAIRQMNIDWLFVIGWSQIVKKDVLDAPKKGCVGMHPTLLPMGRGRAAIPWAILKGLDKTGVSMFRMDEGVDTGEILGQVVVPMSPNITATELYEAVNGAHIQLIDENWAAIVGDTIVPQKQDESKATIWEGRKPEDGELFHSMTVCEADRMVRAVTHPYPGAFVQENGTKTVIWAAEFGGEPKPGAFRLADGYLYPTAFEIVSMEK